MEKYLAYWKRNLYLGFRRAKDWLGVRGMLIDAAISTVLALWYSNSQTEDQGIIVPLVLWFVLVMAIFGMVGCVFTFLIVPYQDKMKQTSIISKLRKRRRHPPELTKLSKLRTDGVVKRNYGESITDISLLPSWIQDYEHWNDEVKALIEKLAPAEVDQIGTLDKFTMKISPTDLSFDHSKYISMFSEKLTRLYKFIHDYSLSHYGKVK